MRKILCILSLVAAQASAQTFTRLMETCIINNEAKPLSIQLGKKYLNINLVAHSFNTFVEK